jgi:hypothetical protein
VTLAVESPSSWRARLRVRASRITVVRVPGAVAFWTATLAAHAFVGWAYLWMATGGTFESDPVPGSLYDLLAQAFLAGQLHLQIAPSAELLALANPYDPLQQLFVRLPDASLFDGKYYVYFGPVPALVDALWRLLGGTPAHDIVLQFVFGFGSCLWTWMILRYLKERAFAQVPYALVLVAYLCSAIGGVGLYLEARVIVHHLAILAASFFMLGGVYFWLRGQSGGRFATAELAVGGLLFGLGFGSRFTALAYAGGAGLVLLWQWAQAPRSQQALRNFFAFAVPSGTILVVLLAYNYARFGSPFEFGLRYALTGIINFNDGGGFTEVHTFWENVGVYFFYLPRFLPIFPYQFAASNNYVTPAFLPTTPTGVWAADFPFVSAFALAPLVLLAPVALQLVVPRRPRADVTIRGFVAAMGLGTLGCFAVVFTSRYSAGRYLQDFLPVLCLLGALGLWQCWIALSHRRWGRWWGTALGTLLLAISAFMGSGYSFASLGVGRPDAYAMLARRVDLKTESFFRHVAPDFWTTTYSSAIVRNRPLGIFYPEGSVLDLEWPADKQAVAIQVESMFLNPTFVIVEADGRQSTEQLMPAGVHWLLLPPRTSAGPNGRIAIRILLPNVPQLESGRLHPLLIQRLGNA